MILIRLIRGCKKKKGVEQDVFLILCQLLVLVTCQLYLIGLNGAGEGKNWRSNSAFNYMWIPCSGYMSMIFDSTNGRLQKKRCKASGAFDCMSIPCFGSKQLD